MDTHSQTLAAHTHLNPFNLAASVTSPLIEILTLLQELKVKG